MLPGLSAMLTGKPRVSVYLLVFVLLSNIARATGKYVTVGVFSDDIYTTNLRQYKINS